MKGIIYKNLLFYRTFMMLLTAGKHRKTLLIPASFIKAASITELCFGDTIIADYCRKKSISWIGIDINPVFVNSAIKKGYDARIADLRNFNNFPETEAYLICNSLYHFKNEICELFHNIMLKTKSLWIWEPFNNWGNNKTIAPIVSYLTYCKESEPGFRFNETTLTESIENCCRELNLSYSIPYRNSGHFLFLIEKP